MAEREKEESDWPQRNTSVARGRQRGIWKGDGDGLFLTGNSSGVECVVILGSIYSALGGSDGWTLEETLFSVISCFAILFSFFFVSSYFLSPAYYRRWGVNGRIGSKLVLPGSVAKAP